MESSTIIENATAAPANPLSELMPVREWVKIHGKPVFQSYDSFDWFVRQHQDRFAQCPDWIVTGKGKYCGPGMAAFVRELLNEDTRQAMANRQALATRPAGIQQAGEKRPRGRPRKMP